MRGPVTLAVAAAVALAGCGSGGGGGKTVTVSAGKPIAVIANEYRFDPGNIVVKGGGPVRIVVRNNGTQAHDLHVERGGNDLGGTPIFSGGQTKTATLKLPAGRYNFVCTVGDHEQLGMKGTLTVK